MISVFIINLISEIYGKKWRAAVILILLDGPFRFSEIHKDVPGCSVKVLSDVLKELVKNNIVIRKQYETIPVKVTYELNPDFIDIAKHYKQGYKNFSHFFVKNKTLFNIPEKVIKEIK